jgi:hypothetical protein
MGMMNGIITGADVGSIIIRLPECGAEIEIHRKHLRGVSPKYGQPVALGVIDGRFAVLPRVDDKENPYRQTVEKLLSSLDDLLVRGADGVD